MKTQKQRQIMAVVMREAGAGRFLSVKELHALLPYACHYGSFRMSINHLVDHGMIVRERAGRCVLLKPTVEAYACFA